MADQLKDKVAIITGSGRGQGLSAALLFASEGASIVVNDLDEASVNQAVARIEDTGGQAVGAVGDVSDSADVQRILETAKSTYGGLDILYNNAGIGYSAKERMGIGMTDVLACTEEDWDRIIDINLRSVFLFCKYGVPLLIERGGGSIINTASIAAISGGPSAHAYTASKGGIVSLTRSVAATYGKNGVRCNAILPGVIDTEMIQSHMLPNDDVRGAIARNTPTGRIGTAEDIANMALFLASDASSFVTGQMMVVDGGLTAR